VLKVPDVVDRLVELATSHEKKLVVKESCWCLSKTTAGSSQQIQMVMKNDEQIANLITLSQRPEPDVKKNQKSLFFLWDVATNF